MLVEEGEKIGTPLLEQLNEDIFDFEGDSFDFAQDKFDFDKLKIIFLTQKGDIRKKLTSKKFQTAHPHAYSLLIDEQERVLRTQERINSQITAEYNEALAVVAKAVIEKYEQLKAKDGLLEYDDLIINTMRLLQESDNAYYALYNLDITIDHILIDEAQDTNSIQWDLIKLISEDFFSGIGARDVDRTLFIVGDFKQSIYSFQRASPEEFARMQNDFKKKINDANQLWESVQMGISFRSTKSVLQAVDSVFNDPDLRKGLSIDDINHQSFRIGQAGSVELWPLFENEPSPDINLWEPPITITENPSGQANSLVPATFKI